MYMYSVYMYHTRYMYMYMYKTVNWLKVHSSPIFRGVAQMYGILIVQFYTFVFTTEQNPGINILPAFLTLIITLITLCDAM